MSTRVEKAVILSTYVSMLLYYLVAAVAVTRYPLLNKDLHSVLLNTLLSIHYSIYSCRTPNMLHCTEIAFIFRLLLQDSLILQNCARHCCKI